MRILSGVLCGLPIDVRWKHKVALTRWGSVGMNLLVAVTRYMFRIQVYSLYNVTQGTGRISLCRELHYTESGHEHRQYVYQNAAYCATKYTTLSTVKNVRISEHSTLCTPKYRRRAGDSIMRIGSTAKLL